MAKKISCCVSDDWEVQDAFRTLCRAKEIEKDKKMMEKVKVYAQKQLESAAGIVSEASED